MDSYLQLSPFAFCWELTDALKVGAPPCSMARLDHWDPVGPLNVAAKATLHPTHVGAFSSRNSASNGALLFDLYFETDRSPICRVNTGGQNQRVAPVRPFTMQG